jgi:branched-chain amino acid transport system permease protein
MSPAWQYFIITLLVYFGTNAIACWSLNLQYGVAGIMNFGFIVFQAAGAYTVAVLTLGPAGAYGFQHYIVGLSLPWPVSLLLAMVVGAALSAVVGVIALRPRRVDYQAVLMLIVSIIATTVVATQTGLFNGANGLSDLPKPFSTTFGASEIGYGWFYVLLTAGVAVVGYAFVHRITGSPWGRRLRSVRENPEAAAALGTDVNRQRLVVFMVGGALAALSGGVLVQFISAWAPAGWTYPETFLYFAAIIVGGLGNNFGVMLGAAVVLTGILESVQFIPSFGVAGVAESVQWIAVGLLVIAFLWFRPKGLVPERRRILEPTGGLGEGSFHAYPRVSLAGGEPPVARRPAAASDTMLSVERLRRVFGGLVAVDEASFTVERGKVTALIGPNGAGKTTVLNVVAGRYPPTSGAIVFEGVDIAGEPSHRVARRGIVRTFQLVGEFEQLTVVENLLLGARLGKGDTLAGALAGKRFWRRAQEEQIEQAVALLDRFGLSHIRHSYMGELSGGQKRMVEIMRALMSDPSLLLLDEPFAGVSPALSREVEDHLAALRNEGHTILLIEHELGVVDRLSDSVVMVAQGRVFARGTMSELRENRGVVEAYLVG